MIAAAAVPSAWTRLAFAGLALGVAGAAALAFARTPWLGEVTGLRQVFGHALVMHVALATVVWLQGLLAALSSSVSAPGAAIAMGSRRLAWWLAACGAAAMLAASFSGAPAILSNYLPVIDHPLFFAGLAAYAAGVLLALTVSLCCGPAPAALSAAAGSEAAARVAVLLALLPLSIAFGSAVAAAAALPPEARGAQAERIFWAPGHALQFAHVLLAEAAWLWLLRERRSRPAVALAGVVLTALPVLLAPWIEWRWSSDTAQFRLAFTRLMQWGSWPGPALVVASLLLARARRQPGSGQPLRPGEGLAWASIALFGAGIGLATLIQGETTMVPAHYHGTVGAATLAGVGLVLEFLRAGARRAGPARAIAPLYASGFGLVVAGLAVAGLARMPRKLPDPDRLLEMPAAQAGLVAMAVGAALAVFALLWLALRMWQAGDPARSGLRRHAAARAGNPLPRRLRPATDRRPHAIGGTVAAIALIGTALSWWTGAPTPPLARAEAIASPAGDGEVHQRFQQGVWMLHARQYEHALVAFHRVIELVPDMPEAHVNLGFAFLGLGRFPQARDFFESAIDLRAEQLNAYYGLASALEGLGDLGGAIGAMRTYTHLARSDDPYLRKAQAALWEWEARARPARGPAR